MVQLIFMLVILHLSRRTECPAPLEIVQSVLPALATAQLCVCCTLVFQLTKVKQGAQRSRRLSLQRTAQ
jgi:hypothetical protein